MTRLFKIVLVSCLSALALCLLLAGIFYTNFFNHLIYWKPVRIYEAQDHYILRELTQALKTPQTSLPDISKYSLDSILKKQPSKLVSGNITIEPLEKIPEVEQILANGKIDKFKAMQNRPDPQAIVIETGAYDLAKLTTELNKKDLLEKIDDSFYLRAPLIVRHAASLSISDATLRLSTDRGALIINTGLFFIINSNISSWSEAKGDYSFYDGQSKNFRPFLIAWDGAETYMAQSSFKHLGYNDTKSYGLTFSSDKIYRKNNPGFSYPKGIMLNCQVEDSYYGFNSYEAKNSLILNSEFNNNILYGIILHDKSEGFTISNNKIFNTKEKHGLLLARFTDNNWIFDNSISYSAMSGIMLDRRSGKNVILNNLSRDNKGDGITIFESPDNLILDNVISHNGKSGLRIRNSWNIAANDNKIYRNEEAGVTVYTQDISDNGTRDFEADPFIRRAELSLNKGIIGFNSGGQLRIQDVDLLKLSKVNFVLSPGESFRGDLSDFKDIVMQGLIQSQNGIEIVRSKNAPNLPQKIPSSNDGY